MSAAEATCPEPSTGKVSDPHKWMQYSEKHVFIHCFLTYLHSAFSSRTYLPVYDIMVFLHFYFLYSYI